MDLTTIAIADDHPLVLQALKEVLHRVPAFKVIHECRSGADLLNALAVFPANLVVTDFGMSQDEHSIDGFNLLRKLQNMLPDSRIILLTAQTNPAVLARAMKMAAHAVVSKEDELEEVVQACLQVRRGDEPYYSITARNLIERASQGNEVRWKILTPREMEVVRLFAEGHSLTDIADKLCRAVSTVSTQKHSAMKKLGVATNIDLVRYIDEGGLL